MSIHTYTYTYVYICIYIYILLTLVKCPIHNTEKQMMDLEHTFFFSCSPAERKFSNVFLKSTVFFFIHKGLPTSYWTF